MNSTKLSTILNRMDRWQSIYTIEEQYKVRDIDDAIRSLLRTTQTPWSLKKSTIRIFNDILEYPIASDHDELYFIENKQSENGNTIFQNERGNFKFTSLKEFYDNPDYRNDMAEIFNNGTKYLGIRYNDFQSANILIDNAETASRYTASGDASGITLDNVFYKEGNGSIKFGITQSTNTATVAIAPSSLTDSNYKRKYFFVNLYIGGSTIPASIDLKYGTDSSNYLTKNITTQFSGSPLISGDWNLLAFDLNDATAVGTITSDTFSYASITLNTATSGTYYLDASYLREWALMDYWYYSNYNVKTVGSSIANQKYFMNASETYSLDSELVGDDEWVDVVMYDALLTGINEKENQSIISLINLKRNEAWARFLENYPSGKPLMTTSKYNFSNDFLTPYYGL